MYLNDEEHPRFVVPNTSHPSLDYVFLSNSKNSSTLGCEKHAEGEANVRHNIRERHTWARRRCAETGDVEIRGWGGVNLVLSGDFWQFTPVKDTAIFADPFAKLKEGVFPYRTFDIWDCIQQSSAALS